MSQLILTSNYFNLFTFFGIKNYIREMRNQAFSFHSFNTWLKKDIIWQKKSHVFKTWREGCPQLRGRKNPLTDQYVNPVLHDTECLILGTNHIPLVLSASSFPILVSYSDSPFTRLSSYSHFICLCSSSDFSTLFSRPWIYKRP